MFCSLFSIGDSIQRSKGASDFSPSFHDEKLKKDDVLVSSRLVEALENENEPNWKEVKQMKDILGMHKQLFSLYLDKGSIYHAVELNEAKEFFSFSD